MSSTIWPDPPPYDPTRPSILDTSKTPLVCPELMEMVRARRQIPQALFDSFAHYMTVIRPSLMRDQPELIGNWLFLNNGEFSAVCPKCPINEMLQVFGSSRLTGREVSFVVRLGEEFHDMNGGHIGAVPIKENPKRLWTALLLELSDGSDSDPLQTLVDNMLISTGTDDVVIFNYSESLDSGWRYPVVFGAESGPTPIPSLSLIANLLVGVPVARLIPIPRIVIPFDLALTYKLYKYWADSTESAASPDSVDITVLDEVVPAGSSLAFKLREWLSEPFRVPEHPDLKLFFLSKGLSLQQAGWQHNGLIGLSFLLQTEFRYHPEEGEMQFYY